MTQVLRDTTHSGLTLEYEIAAVHAEARTPYQHVLIGETTAFGRALFMDGILMSAQADEGLYHSALVHPAMLTHSAPRRVLIGGGGEGATLREVLRHPSVERVTMVDIDEQAVQLCREHLAAWHRGAFSDPRASVVYEDIRSVLSGAERDSYDVIILDLGDPATSETSRPAATREFYQLVRAALRPGGVAAVQAGEYGGVLSCTYRSFVTTLRGVFRDVRPYRVPIPSFCAIWGFAMVSDSSLTLAPQELKTRWTNVGGDTWMDYDPQSHLAWMSLSRRERQVLSGQARMLTDAAPLDLMSPTDA